MPRCFICTGSGRYYYDGAGLPRAWEDCDWCRGTGELSGTDIDAMAQGEVPMRPDHKIPEKLPALGKVREVFEKWFKAPTKVLNGKAPMELFREHGVEDAWVVGSCAWFPVLHGKPHDEASDIDVVLLNASAVPDFVKHAINLLLTSDKLNADASVRYVQEDNIHEGVNIVRTWVDASHRLQKKTVVGVWSLNDEKKRNLNIAEHVKEYPLEHQRCAIEVATLSVTRLVRIDTAGQASAEYYRRGNRAYTRGS